MIDQLTQVAGAKNPDGSYALGDAVRPRCAGKCRESYKTQQAEQVISIDGIYHHPGCCGWNASTDLAVWLEACGPLGFTRIDLLYATKWYVALEHGGDASSGSSVLEALVSALGGALVAQGAELEEVKDGT